MFFGEWAGHHRRDSCCGRSPSIFFHFAPLRRKVKKNTWASTATTIPAMMPCPFSEKHLPSQATGLALLPARKATPGPGSGSCCARGVSALWSSTKVPVAANLKLKPQPKPEELATERTLRPLRKQRASPPGQLFFWILKKADDFPTPTMPISRRGRKPSVRQDFAPVPIAQACPSRKSPA